MKDGLAASDVVPFTYTVVTKDGLSTMAEAKAAAADAPGVKVCGVVTYLSGSNVYVLDPTWAICLYLNASAAALAVGDEIIVSGKRAAFNNLSELSEINEDDIAIASRGNAVPDRGVATIAELIAAPYGKTAGYSHMCEIIRVEGAVLTSGSKLTIFPALNLGSYPGIYAGGKVNATIRMYDYKAEADVVSLSLPSRTPGVTAEASIPYTLGAGEDPQRGHSVLS